MKTRLLLNSVLISILVPCVAADPATRPDFVVPDPQPNFDFMVPEIKLDRVGLGDTIDRLHTMSGSNFVVNWPRLKTLKVVPTTPVTFTGRHLPLGAIVITVLNRTNPRLSFSIAHGAAYISTRDDVKELPNVTRPAAEAVAPNARTAAALEAEVTEIKFEGTRLTDVLSQMKEKLELPLEVDWKALKEAGIDRDVLVTLSLKRVGRSDVLYWVLAGLPSKSPIQYAVREDKIDVSSKAAFDQK